MARHKHIDTSPRFLAVDLERQLLPGTFEHALCRLIDWEIDLTGFDARYHDDLTGAAAYPPAMLLKVVLFAYSRGMKSHSGQRQLRFQAHKFFPVISKSKSLLFGLWQSRWSVLGMRPSSFSAVAA